MPWGGQAHQQISNDMQNNGFTELVGIIAGTEIPHGNDATLLRTNDIKQALQELLPSYMILNTVFFIDALPLNLNGKVNHKALEEIVSGHIS
jgi:acyl-coenzyme A synthetase/AMP-(fatty) acid ligase